MAVAMYMTFPNTKSDQYDQVIRELNLKTQTPKGLLHHVAGPKDGGWCVVDVWESQGHFDAFLKERLAKAMERAKIAPPVVQTFTVHNTMGALVTART